MNITINTKILKKHNISLGEFLLMLLGYFEIDIEECHSTIIKKALAERNVMKNMGIILSNNNKDLVAQILLEMNEKVIKSGIDFDDLAAKLIDCYPKGNKPGTTYQWGSTVDVIAQKLRTLIAVHNFYFTPEEAIQATKDYVSSFKSPYQDMLLLRSFLLTTHKSSVDNIPEIDSTFMTFVENNRDSLTEKDTLTSPNAFDLHDCYDAIGGDWQG
jgi:hypothetical protein